MFYNLLHIWKHLYEDKCQQIIVKVKSTLKILFKEKQSRFKPTWRVSVPDGYWYRADIIVINIVISAEKLNFKSLDVS